jgi:RNA recognition motif. (a.k.a. RRM, RBD, or RNP domain)
LLLYRTDIAISLAQKALDDFTDIGSRKLFMLFSRYVAQSVTSTLARYNRDNMTRTSAFLLPLLAFFQNARGYHIQKLPTFGLISRGFRSSSTFLKMSDVDENVKAQEKVVKFGYQVFMGNLPFNVDETQLSDVISSRGIACSKVRIAKDRNTGRSRGFAYLDFEGKDGAEAAVSALSGLQVEGRDVKVDLSEPKEVNYSNDGTNTREKRDRVRTQQSVNSVFVGNLDFATTDEDLKNVFESVLGDGSVRSVRLGTDRETGKSICHLMLKDVKSPVDSSPLSLNLSSHAFFNACNIYYIT